MHLFMRVEQDGGNEQVECGSEGSTLRQIGKAKETGMSDIYRWPTLRRTFGLSTSGAEAALCKLKVNRGPRSLDNLLCGGW